MDRIRRGRELEGLRDVQWLVHRELSVADDVGDLDRTQDDAQPVGGLLDGEHPPGRTAGEQQDLTLDDFTGAEAAGSIVQINPSALTRGSHWRRPAVDDVRSILRQRCAMPSVPPAVRPASGRDAGQARGTCRRARGRRWRRRSGWRAGHQDRRGRDRRGGKRGRCSSAWRAHL